MNWYSSNLCSNTFRSHITYPLSKMCVSDIMYMKTMLHLLYKKKEKWFIKGDWNKNISQYLCFKIVESHATCPLSKTSQQYYMKTMLYVLYKSNNNILKVVKPNTFSLNYSIHVSFKKVEKIVVQLIRLNNNLINLFTNN